MKLVNWLTYFMDANRIREVFSLPSKTVPDMTLSIRDLVERHKKGINVKTFSPVYSEKYVGLERMDRIERAELVQKLGDFVSDSRGRLMSARQAAKKAANDAAVIAEYEKRKSVKDKVVDDSVPDTVVDDPKPGKGK